VVTGNWFHSSGVWTSHSKGSPANQFVATHGTQESPSVMQRQLDKFSV